MARDTDQAVTAGQVVHFVWVDPILGGQLERVALVLDAGGDVSTVAPLAGYTLAVPTADLEPVRVAGDVPATPEGSAGGTSS